MREFESMFAHMAWADARLLDALRTDDDRAPDDRARDHRAPDPRSDDGRAPTDAYTDAYADPSADPARGSVPALLAHVVAAETVWLARLRGEEEAPVEVWPELDLDGVATLAERTHSAWADYLMSLGPRGLDRRVTYLNSRGVQYHTRVRDILTQVALHGSYHRGQIASAVRAAGYDPVNTDYITYVRETEADGGRIRRVW